MPKTSATTDNTIAIRERELPTQENASKRSSNSKAAEKTAKLLSFDSEMQKKWLRVKSAVLVGTDEVGRGCLAGPVVAAVVEIPRAEETDKELAEKLSGLNDSKKLSPQKRAELASVIKDKCRYAIAEASVEEIEKVNILQASFLAMKRALAQLCVPETSALLVDGSMKIPKLAMRQILVVGGDGISASIAAASIIAKVHRDSLMCSLHEEFPQYCWDSNKGYGSAEHRAAILEHGLTRWHRPSFCRKICNEQLSLLQGSRLS